MKRIVSLLLCALCLLVLAACGGKDDSALTELRFRDLDSVPLVSEQALQDMTSATAGPGAVFSENLTAAEVESLLTGDVFSGMLGSVALNADGTLQSVDLIHETESKQGTYTVINEMVTLFPGALPDAMEPTCTVRDTPVDAIRWKANGSVCYTAAFLRADTGVAVRATVFCNPSEGDRREDCVQRLWQLTDACLNPGNTLTLDSVYSGPEFHRRTETALVPLPIETEAALRAGAEQAMERYLASTPLDPITPAESACDALIIRAVSPEGDRMLADASMAYLPARWDFGEVDDAYRFGESGVPFWYSDQTDLRRGSGDRAECLVGMQSLLFVRGADGTWRVSEDGPAGRTGLWLDREPQFADYLRVRWTV